MKCILFIINNNIYNTRMCGLYMPSILAPLWLLVALHCRPSDHSHQHLVSHCHIRGGGGSFSPPYLHKPKRALKILATEGTLGACGPCLWLPDPSCVEKILSLKSMKGIIMNNRQNVFFQWIICGWFISTRITHKTSFFCLTLFAKNMFFLY